MDSMKRDLKQKNGMIQSLQTRLDRCTEENRRLKSQHQSTQINMRVKNFKYKYKDTKGMISIDFLCF